MLDKNSSVRVCIAVCTGIGGKIDNLKGRAFTSD